MAISFQCDSCQRRYKAGDEAAGKHILCKQCGERIVIPEVEDPGFEIVDDESGSDGEIAPAVEVPSALERRPKVKKKSAKKSKPTNLAGLLEKVDEWPGGKVVWLPSAGVILLVGVILGLTHLSQFLSILAFVGGWCMLGAGVMALWATIRQGVLAFLSLFAGLVMTPVFLASLTGKIGMGWIEALPLMLTPYAFFYLRMSKPDLYRRPIAIGLLGLGLVVPGVVYAMVGPQKAPILNADGTSGPVVKPWLRKAPTFPDLGPGTEIEPGVVFREVRLPGGPGPGQSGKLWLYLPGEPHDPKSLPCVLITGAGSNLATGMDLGDGDRAEHLPYVRAGFAVLAYELDGALPNLQTASSAEMKAAGRKFLAAEAGLLNAHVALEFLKARVPEVDPSRIFAAGHSSAGTMALVLAATEPRIKGCVAYAPETDVEAKFGFMGLAMLRSFGLEALATQYSPKAVEGRLNCPTFLFVARDDSVVPIARTESFAARLRKLGKPVTLEEVPTGDHYDSMIQQGIPKGIAWLKALPASSPAPATSESPKPAS